MPRSSYVLSLVMSARVALQGTRHTPQKGTPTMPYITSTTQVQPGSFVSYSLVTDSVTYEVIKTTERTITIRRTKQGEVLRKENYGGNPYPVLWKECVSDEEGRTMTLRQRKDGHFGPKCGASYSRIRHATLVDGKPVQRTDYRY